MKKSITIGLFAAATLLLSACGNSEAGLPNTGTSQSNKGSEKQSLVVSTFGLSEDLVKRDVLGPFETQEKVTITTEVGNGSDRLTKLQNNPNSTIDVMELPQANASHQTEKPLFEELKAEDFKNFDQLTDAAKEVFESGAGLPTTVNSVGIIYNKKALGKEMTEWKDLWSKDLKNAISIPDITTTAGPLMLYLASDTLGQKISDDNGQAAFKALKELKPNIVKTYTKSSDLANMFQSGEIKAAVVMDFAVDVIEKANPDVAYFVPESGTYANFNTMNIPVQSKHKELAKKYLDYRISKEAQSKKAQGDSLNEGPINKEVKLDEQQAKNKTYGTIADLAKPVDFRFVDSQLKDWIDQWNKMMNQ